MRISFKLLNEFIDLQRDPKDIANVLTSIGFEVEEFIDFAEKYRNFFVAEVKSVEKITEKLSFCKVDNGKETVDVVCGAPNVANGQKVVLAMPGAIIPKGEFEIKPTVIRGYRSNGMICSEDELEIGDCADEILVLEESAPVGKPFSEYFGLDDVVFEIGITPNRGDCLSHLGIARELSAYFEIPLRIPFFEMKENSDVNISQFVSVEILDTEKCPRYSAKLIKNVKVGESPSWLKSKLILLGLRPINSIVDVTNYVMMELGQPLHAFDFDKLALNKIIVRTASEGEKFVTLDGKERILDSSMLMICDGEKPVAIGGVMGGENSEITSDTRNVLLESAFFNPASIRRTSKKLGLSSESSYRFERGVDYDNVVFALNRAANLIAYLGNGELVSGNIDVYPNKIPRKFVSFRFERARNVIGADISNETMVNYLVHLGFKIADQKLGKVVFEVPSHRFDVEQEIDLIEEVARFFGYDKIPEDRSFSITFSGDKYKTELDIPPIRKDVKNYFIARGFVEILTQNLYNPKKMGIFNSSEYIELENPLGEEYSIMRPSILPSMLEVVKLNLNVGKKDLRLFEIGKEFRKDPKANKFIEGIEEREVLCIGLSGLAFPFQWGMNNRKVDFYDLKGIFEHFLHTFKVQDYEISFEVAETKVFKPEHAFIKINGKIEGEFGFISNTVKKLFDVEEDALVGYLNLEQIYLFEQKLPQYERISPFPVVRRDLAFVVDESLPSQKLFDIIRNSAGEYLREITLFDVFRGKNIGEGKKNLAFALFFNSDERTLTDEEVQDWVNNIVEKVKSEVGGELRIF
ncbi:MAG: Phenylalanyl-tRNA synthetase beta chain [Candidatus Kapaibacterium sp.]|nr:MAG: Phenylalanyl-tRNA synthetase beta chain [Candidatus Kapabacteria bacterium]